MGRTRESIATRRSVLPPARWIGQSQVQPSLRDSTRR